MTTIRVKDGESIEGALKRFKKATEKAGILSEIRKREHYEKPSVKRKKKMLAIKKRRDSVEQYRAGGRTDLAEKEEKEIALLQGYLPAQLSAAELVAAVTDGIKEANAKGPKDMGAVMKVLTPKLKGKAEGKALS